MQPILTIPWLLTHLFDNKSDSFYPDDWLDESQAGIFTRIVDQMHPGVFVSPSQNTVFDSRNVWTAELVTVNLQIISQTRIDASYDELVYLNNLVEDCFHLIYTFGIAVDSDLVQNFIECSFCFFCIFLWVKNLLIHKFFFIIWTPTALWTWIVSIRVKSRLPGVRLVI